MRIFSAKALNATWRWPLIAVLLPVMFATSSAGAAETREQQPAGHVGGQFVQAVGVDESTTSEPSTYLTDPGVRRRLSEAERLVKENRLDQVLGLVQSVLDEPDESFVRHEGDGWLPARMAAEKILESMEPAGLARYREQREDEAAYLLRQGLLTNDPNLWSQVMRRYFLTQAGFDATNLLASYQLDRGNAALALVYLDRLLESPVHRRQVTDTMRAKRAVAQALLGRLDNAKQSLKGIGHDPLQLGGNRWPAARVLESVPSADHTLAGKPADAQQWPIFGGNRQRSPQMTGGAPLMFSEWTSATLSDKGSGLKTVLGNVADQNRTQRTVLDFGLQPVAWEHMVFYRNLDQTQAIHVETGQVLWTYGDGSSIEAGFRETYPRFPPNAAAIPSIQSTFVCNSIYGTLSTDGERLYQIDELVLNPNPYPMRVVGARRGEDDLPDRSRNRLTALNVTTGKVVWTAGSVDDKSQSGLDGTFFLGPPLPVDDVLYVLGEIRSEIRLYCLEPATGRLKWSQVLALCQRPIDADLYRQTQAAYLAYADGILICPTNLMRIIALDPLTRTVLWHYPYAEQNGRLPQQFAPMQFMQPLSNTYASDPPMIEAGKVVLTSPQGNTIHCVDLQTGRVMWRTSRDGAQYLLGVFDGHMILVGADHVRAHRLEDGARAWKQTSELPSGRGLRVGDALFLPQADGAIAVIELKTGRVAERLFTRGREPVGNLLVHGKHVLASGHSGLDAFPMLEQVETEMQARLTANPKDPLGLYRRAQIALTKGTLSPAVDDLRGALDVADPPDLSAKARALLFDIAEREALVDPGSMTALVEEIGKLATDPVEKGVYFRLLARNRLANKEYAAALDAVAKHTDLPLTDLIKDGHDPVERSPRVWTRRFMRDLLDSAGPEQAATLLQPIDARIKAVAARKEAGVLEGLASSYAGLPSGDQAYQLLGDLLTAKMQLGEAEVAYLSVVGTGRAEVKANALAAAATVAQAMKEPADALHYLQKLAAAYPQVSIPGKGTGQTALDGFLKSKEGAEAALAMRATPNFDAVNVVTIKDTRLESSRRMVLTTDGDLPYFANRLFAFDHQNTALECFRQGSERQEWQVNLSTSQNQFWPFRFETMGHLVFFAMGDMIHGISAYDQKLIWSRRFDVTTGNMIAVIPAQRSSRSRDRTGSISLIGSGYIAINTGKDLYLVDPWTGRDLWVRHQVESDQIIFGDDEYLFIVSRDLSYVTHRTLDGQIVRTGRFGASFSNRKAIAGRHILSAAIEDGKLVARYWDPWQKNTLWAKAFPPNTKAFVGDHDELILVAKEGPLSVLHPTSGRVIMEDTLEKDKTDRIANVQLFRDPSRTYLAIDYRPTGRNIFPMPSMPPNLISCHVNGSIRAYDGSTNKLLWNRDLENLSVIVRPGADLPILIGSGTTFVTRNKNNAPVLAIELIDKRNGKTLHRLQRDDLNPIADLAYDLSDRWIELRSWNSKVRIELKGGETSP